MHPSRACRATLLLVCACLLAGLPLRASVYDGQPRLVVVVIVDQLRADLLQRYRSRLAQDGFRRFLEHGAYFADCRYDYINTRTSPGHATLLTGAYVSGHGLAGNWWWSSQDQKVISAVTDPDYTLVGAAGPGGSPRRLMASTLGDEMKLATGGKSRVISVSFKDYAAIISGGYSADAAYWIDRRSGAWLTSSYYMRELPAWISSYNRQDPGAQYWDREWKDAQGQVLFATPRSPDKDRFYSVVGETPFGLEYFFHFARELVTREKLGQGPNTDLLILSVSPTDATGHDYGPDSPQVAAMLLAADRLLAEFFGFLDHQVGLKNTWLALSSDHGIPPIYNYASRMGFPAGTLDNSSMRDRANRRLARRFDGEDRRYIPFIEWPLAYLDPAAFAQAGVKSEADAEQMVGETLADLAGLRGFYTRWQAEHGMLPPNDRGRQFANSVSLQTGWYVLLDPAIYSIGTRTSTDHATGNSYDRFVPLAFWGAPFRPGTYLTPAEPTDLAATLAALLGITPPTHSVGRVLVEALQQDAGKIPANTVGR